MPTMPLNGKPLADGEIELIRQWIDAGAKDDTAGVARPNRASIPHIEPRKAVKAQIASLAWRPDGKLIALGLYREVKLVDAATGAAVATLANHAEQVRAVAFTRDGKLLAAAGGLPARKGEVKIWSVDDRAEVRSIAGHADCIYAAAFSPDGKVLATASYDKLIKLWDVATGKELRTLKDHIDAIYALGFAADGARLVSASADRSVKVWNVATGERAYTMSEATDGLNTLAIDPSGKFVAAAGLDKTIRVWELGEKAATLRGSVIAHEDAILKLAWSPDGAAIVSSAADRSLKAFKWPGLAQAAEYPKQSDWVAAMEFSPDGKKLAVGRFDGSLGFLEVRK
jgi:WD40 repeat protein